jgi:hypothetical protein
MSALDNRFYTCLAIYILISTAANAALITVFIG